MLGNIMRYGAVTTKIRAMYGARLSEEDFRKIASSEELPEVAAFLKSHSLWGRAFTHTDPGSLGRDRLEYLLRQHYMEEYMRLLHYLNREDQEAARYPVLTAEIEQIMRYMRLAAAERVDEYICDLPPFFNRHSRIEYDHLSRAETYEGMLAAVRQTSFYPALRRLAPPDGAFPEYLDVELAMRAYFFRSIIELAKRYGGEEAKLFTEWAGLQADWYNITTLARVIHGYPQMRDSVLRYLLPIHAKLRPSELSALAEAGDTEEFMTALAATRNGRQAAREGPLTIQSLEAAAKRQQLRYCRRHISSDLPSAFTVVAYTQLLRGEMENLICVIECVRYRLPPAKAMERIIME